MCYPWRGGQRTNQRTALVVNKLAFWAHNQVLLRLMNVSLSAAETPLQIPNESLLVLFISHRVWAPVPVGGAVGVTMWEFLLGTVASGPCGFPLPHVSLRRAHCPAIEAAMVTVTSDFLNPEGPSFSSARPPRGWVWLGCSRELSGAGGWSMSHPTSYRLQPRLPLTLAHFVLQVSFVPAD